MAYTNIDDPSAHFQTTLYTGDGNSGRTVTNGGNSDLQPDWIWIKYRPAGVSHVTYDSSRGTNKRLYIDFGGAEATVTEGVQAFSSDGFTLGNLGESNGNTVTFVAWQWHANGGSTSSNTDGSITSTVQANTDAGFSIVTYSGNSTSGATIGHGLGAVPKMIIVKRRNSANRDWAIYHKDVGNTDYLKLNSDDGPTDNSAYWNDTTPTSSVFTVGTGTNSRVNAGTLVAYCFAEKQGFSKFGKYVGNGSTNGAFVHTGFKPEFFMYKKLGSGDGWFVFDAARNPVNSSTNQTIRADTSGAEGASKVLDFLSNGIKFKNDDTAHNGSGTTYIYMAFAKNPFVTSDTGGSIPTTAF